MTSLFYLLITCHWICVTMAMKTLYIGGLFDLGKLESWKVIPAAQMAIDEINNRTFLPGYRLELLINDTRIGNLKIASGVHNYLNSGPRKLMLLGPVDNDIAKSIAYYAAVPQYGILQFSYGTDDLSLANDRNLYPYFFRTPISMATFDDLRIAFIKSFSHWTEVGIIHGDNLLDTQLSNQFKSRLESKGIKVLAEVRLQASDPRRAIRTIQENDIHIIFGLFAVGHAARRLFCQAYKSGLYGPHYVWILQIAANDGWWVPNTGEDIGGCKEIEMTCQIQNYFHVKPTYGFHYKSLAFAHSNKNTSQLVNDYNSRVDNGNITSNRSSNAWLVYDAVWSIAYVLKNSMGKLGKPLENVTYGDLDASRLFYNETLNLNFESPNRERVRYFSNGDRKFDMNIDQIIIKDGESNTRSINAGNYDFPNEKFNVKSAINWRAGTPYRKTANSYTTRYIHRSLFGALIFLAFLGLLYALVCLVVVLVYRKQPVIWNASPIMNTIIILGCILNYITIILYAFDWTTSTQVTGLCRARAWTFAIGFTLSVGGLVAKLWIAYCVLSERFVRRWRNMLIWMLAIVLVLFIFDLIIMGCWEGIDPLYAKMVVYKEQELYKCFQPITEKTFQADWYTVEHCTCNHPLTWLLIILLLKFFVVLFGVFLAWQTRKLYIKSLNDTQYCGFCLFVVLFFAIFGVLSALLTTKFPNLFFGIVGTVLFVCTTIILALLYIHKMGRVICKPKSRRGKTTLVGDVDRSDTECSYCPCCACSSACCIAFCACFPCCNLYMCCRKCCCGTQVHPSKDDEKTEFYINGQSQDKEGQIAYLLREMHQRDEELARLRPANTCSSIWTQTYDTDLDMYDSAWEDGEGHSTNSDNNDDSFNSGRSSIKRSSVKIFSHGADYSHIQSRVDTRVTRSPRNQKNHDEKYYLGVWQNRGGRPTDAEITKLRAQLAEKDKEIEKLKKEKGSKNVNSVVVNQPLNTSPGTTITIIHEDADSPNTHEKQCQTEDTVLSYKQPNNKPNVVVVKSSSSTNTTSTRKVSKGRKPASTEPKDKVIVIKAKDESEQQKKLKKDERLLKSSAEWLFGKPEENPEERTPERKEDEKYKKDEERTVTVGTKPDKQEVSKATTVVIISPEKEKVTEKENEKVKDEDDKKNNVIYVTQELRDEKEKENDKKEKETEEEKYKEEKQRKEEERRKKQLEKEEQEKEERTRQEKQEEEKRQEEEKQRHEKRKSRFSFFGRKDDSSPIVKSREQGDNELPSKGNDSLTQAKPESPKNDKQEKQEKPESPKTDKQDQPDKTKPAKDDRGRNKVELSDDERSNRIRPPQNTPASVDITPPKDDEKEDRKPTNEEAPKHEDKANNDNTSKANEPDKSDDDLQNIHVDEEQDDDEGTDDGKDENGDDDDEDDDDNDGIKGTNGKPRRRAKKRIGGKLNWKAESKVDTSNAFTRRPSKKIKTYKVDYSHVRSTLSYGGSSKRNDANDKKNESTDNERKKRTKVSRTRWNPSDNRT